MHTTTVVPLFLALSCLATAPAFGQTGWEKIAGEGTEKDTPKDSKAEANPDDELDDKVFYSGFGVSRVGTDYINLGEAINLEGVIGFRIPTLPWFGIELDISQTIIPGENSPEVQPSQNCGGLLQPPCPGATGDPDDLQMQALGLLAAFKSTGRFYVTGKYGYRYIATSIDELNQDRSTTGFALGVGYRWGNRLSGVELGYKQLGEDVESIGLTFYARPSTR